MKRLLRQYPVKLLKQSFNFTGNAVDVVDQIISSHTQQSIKDFALRNMFMTKQHIYMFSLQRRFRPNSIPAGLPINILVNQQNNNEHWISGLNTITYSVVLTNPLQQEDLDFWQPVVLRFTSNRLIIHFTKNEKNVSFYLNDTRKVHVSDRNNEETECLGAIIDFLDPIFVLSPLDFNRGLKHVWERDLIDSRKVQFVKDSSLSSETMHEQFTFKSRYPVEYQQMLRMPLSKTLMKSLAPNQYLCETFTVDPTAGQISIAKFPDDANQVNNVLTEILTNN
jgi:hypothetical protein